MDPLTPERPGGEGPTPHGTAPARPPADLEVPASARPARAGAALLDANVQLGQLLVAMCSESATVREAAWAACYEQYYRVVWTRVFYIVRSIGWLPEPGRVAEDVTSDVFVGLPEAALHYRDDGRAEWWLKQVAVRAALRKKESLTGLWATGKRPSERELSDGARAGRRAVSFDETADQIVERLDAVDQEELMELRRRRQALRDSADPKKRRWDAFLELYVQGHDFKEIGARMGLTEASARNWLCNIRKYLARPVSKDTGDEAHE
jgi:RNA polymerase sigma factor (sigma-70 family)